MKERDDKFTLAIVLGWITFFGLWISYQFPLFDKTAALAPDSLLSYSCFGIFILFSIAIILKGFMSLRSEF